MGDRIARELGVICDPGRTNLEIIITEIHEEDKFIIVCSDGIWEFISNDMVLFKKAVNIVMKFWLMNDIKGACLGLINEATDQWKKTANFRDDITCAIIFLK